MEDYRSQPFGFSQICTFFPLHFLQTEKFLRKSPKSPLSGLVRELLPSPRGRTYGKNTTVDFAPCAALAGGGSLVRRADLPALEVYPHCGRGMAAAARSL